MAGAAKGPATATVVRAVRLGGEICQLVQERAKNGRPLCVSCRKPIPISYFIRHYKHTQSFRRALFCTDRCAWTWAHMAAAGVYVLEEEALTAEARAAVECVTGDDALAAALEAVEGKRK